MGLTWAGSGMVINMAAWGWGEPHLASPSSTLDVELNPIPPMCPEADLKPCGVVFHQHAASLDLFPPQTRLWRWFGLVLGSPVQSGFSFIFRKTETETSPPWLKFSKTETETIIDRSRAVLCGFVRLQDQSEPVTVQTSLQPVQTSLYM